MVTGQIERPQQPAIAPQQILAKAMPENILEGQFVNFAQFKTGVLFQRKGLVPQKNTNFL